MDPQTTPDQQVATPGQQAAGPSGSTAPEGYIEIARFNGLNMKVQELTISNRSLNEQLAQKSSEVEQLKAQLSVKDAEKSVAVGERDTRLNSILSENATLLTEVKELRGLKLKVEVAKKLQRPDLLELVDRIPALEDEEALTTIMKDFASFADKAVQQREQQLLAGYTPPVGPGNIAPSAPATAEAWLEKINDLTLGTPDRAKALNDYGDWLERQNQRK